ncbi:hypothetical protein M885DRAFT_624689, partial [Pelagophyceae sp. CCMP2097]
MPSAVLLLLLLPRDFAAGLVRPSRRYGRVASRRSAASFARGAAADGAADGAAVDALWVKFGSAASRTDAVVALDKLKALGAAERWACAALQPEYRVSVEQLETATRQRNVADAFGVNGNQQLGKISVAAAAVLAAAMLAAVAAQVSLTWLPEILRFTVVQLLCFVPFGAIGVGIAMPEEVQRWLTVAYAAAPAYRARLARHEAGHLVVGHVLGLPVERVRVNAAASAVAFWDLGREDAAALRLPADVAAARPPRFTSRRGKPDFDVLAVVSLAGIMAEVDEWGDAEGGATAAAARPRSPTRAGKASPKPHARPRRRRPCAAAGRTRRRLVYARCGGPAVSGTLGRAPGAPHPQEACSRARGRRRGARGGARRAAERRRVLARARGRRRGARRRAARREPRRAVAARAPRRTRAAARQHRRRGAGVRPGRKVESAVDWRRRPGARLCRDRVVPVVRGPRRHHAPLKARACKENSKA